MTLAVYPSLGFKDLSLAEKTKFQVNSSKRTAQLKHLSAERNSLSISAIVEVIVLVAADLKPCFKEF